MVKMKEPLAGDAEKMLPGITGGGAEGTEPGATSHNNTTTNNKELLRVVPAFLINSSLSLPVHPAVTRLVSPCPSATS